MKARALCVSIVLLVLASGSQARAADPDVTLAPDASRSAPRVTLYASAGGGSVLDKAGGPAPSATGSIRLALPLARFFALEVSGTSGYAVGRGTPDDLWLRLALGLRIEDAHQALRPYGAFRLVHIHFAPVSTWEAHPGDSIAGSSTEGLQHRSGSALAAGLSWSFPHTQDRVRAMAEAEVSWVPIGNPPAWFMTVEAGVGYAF
jgi:hypothetical protein